MVVEPLGGSVARAPAALLDTRLALPVAVLLRHPGAKNSLLTAGLTDVASDCLSSLDDSEGRPFR